MTFARLTRGDWIAALAALALLLVMAMDWYSTDAAEQAREDAAQVKDRGPSSGEVADKVKEDADIVANRREKTAWQAEPFADRVILLALLAAIVLAIAAAWMRAAGRRFDPPLTPSALATGAALAAAVLLAARIIQKPSAEAGAVVKLGAPLGLLCVGIVAIAARTAWKAERDGTAWAKLDADDQADETDARGDARGRLDRPAPLFDHDPPADVEPAAATATAVRPATAEQPAAATPAEEDWAPDWSDSAAPSAEPEPSADDRSRRRRRGGRRGKRPRRF